MVVKRVSLRIDEKTLYKLHVVAAHDQRSVNSEILVLIRDKIEQYEKTHGTIEVNEA